MIELFDTHRLPYKNAVLRAWSDNLKTVALNFFDIPVINGSPISVGDRIRTNEAGYVFNADGTQAIHSLMLAEDAIIEVSLDNGQSWPIQFNIYDFVASTVNTAMASLKSLTYHTKTGTETFNPRFANKELPEYAFKSDFAQGEWGESEIYVDNNDPFEITRWTHYIQLVTGASDVTISGKLRAGQYILFRAGVNCTVRYRGIVTNMLADHVYMWWAINVFTDITYVSDAHITAVATALLHQVFPDPIVYKFQQTDGNYSADQILTPSASNQQTFDEKPNSEAVILVFESTSAHCDTVTLKLDNPTMLGSKTFTALMTRTDTSGTDDIYVQFGNATRVWIGRWASGVPERNCAFNVTTYKSIGNTIYNTVSLLTTDVTNEAQA